MAIALFYLSLCPTTRQAVAGESIPWHRGLVTGSHGAEAHELAEAMPRQDGEDTHTFPKQRIGVSVLWPRSLYPSFGRG
jgi:hypothetical protein